MNMYPECEANADSIRAIPFDELPDREARTELVRRALAGQEIYSYVPCASDHCVVWVRQPHPSLEALFLPMEWARLWHAGLQPDALVLEEDDAPDAPSKPSGENKPQRKQRRQRKWLPWLSVLLLGGSLLTGCDVGPTPDPPPPVVVTAPASVPHRGPILLQIDPDITGSYPKGLRLAFMQQMADWVDKLSVINSAGATVYMTFIDAEPYAPSSTPLSFTIPAIPNWPAAQKQTPVPQCPDKPYDCLNAQATAIAGNDAANATYQQAIDSVQAQLTAVQTTTKQQTQEMRAMRPAMDKRATSLFGVLNLAAQRFKGVNGEKWLALASDMANNTAIDEIPPDLTGVHVLVLYLYCTSAVACQNTKATWSGIFKKAHAASWSFLDPGQSKNATSPWS